MSGGCACVPLFLCSQIINKQGVKKASRAARCVTKLVYKQPICVPASLCSSPCAEGLGLAGWCAPCPTY